ncbi:hypothetical protein BH18ACT4_BH18ACT4_10580 [soil metagenome]
MKSGRILVAEDEERIASLLRKAFAKSGFEIEIAPDGPVALDLLAASSFDLVILDLGLPGIDGREVLRTIRDRGQTLPVVVLTARHEVSDKVDALRGGADDYVTKPFSVHELVARVEARLRPPPGPPIPPPPPPSPSPPKANLTVGRRAGKKRAAAPLGIRVLIVEDEPRIAEFVSRGLSSSGYDVVVAEDGEVGLFLARTESYDVVVLDLNLPGMTGLDVLAGVRADHPDIPVIMLTGMDRPQTRDDALAAGATVFMSKPFQVADLRAAIAEQVPSR